MSKLQIKAVELFVTTITLITIITIITTLRVIEMTNCQNCSYSLADRAWHGLKDRGEDQVSKLFIPHCCMLTIIMIITHCMLTTIMFITHYSQKNHCGDNCNDFLTIMTLLHPWAS